MEFLLTSSNAPYEQRNKKLNINKKSDFLGNKHQRNVYIGTNLREDFFFLMLWETKNDAPRKLFLKAFWSIDFVSFAQHIAMFFLHKNLHVYRQIVNVCCQFFFKFFKFYLFILVYIPDAFELAGRRTLSDPL